MLHLLSIKTQRVNEPSILGTSEFLLGRVTRSLTNFLVYRVGQIPVRHITLQLTCFGLRFAQNFDFLSILVRASAAPKLRIGDVAHGTIAGR